jgi:hypothetical protein
MVCNPPLRAGDCLRWWVFSFSFSRFVFFVFLELPHNVYFNSLDHGCCFFSSSKHLLSPSVSLWASCPTRSSLSPIVLHAPIGSRLLIFTWSIDVFLSLAKPQTLNPISINFSFSRILNFAYNAQRVFHLILLSQRSVAQRRGVFVFAFWFFLYPKPQTLEPFFEVLTAKRKSERSSQIRVHPNTHIRLFLKSHNNVLRTFSNFRFTLFLNFP